MIQYCEITDWLPAQLANGPHGHWAARAKKLQLARTMAWAACKQADWQPVTGRAVLTVMLVFGVKRRRDTDNLHSRCKGLIDGIVRGGWIKDDSTDWLELHVRSSVDPGHKRTLLILEGE